MSEFGERFGDGMRNFCEKREGELEEGEEPRGELLEERS